VALQPIQKGSGKVEGEREEAPFGSSGEKGFVHVSKVIFEDMVEVPDRLVGVKPECEVDRIMHGGFQES